MYSKLVTVVAELVVLVVVDEDVTVVVVLSKSTFFKVSKAILDGSPFPAAFTGAMYTTTFTEGVI
jgi:hypothetical protein